MILLRQFGIDKWALIVAFVCLGISSTGAEAGDWFRAMTAVPVADARQDERRSLQPTPDLSPADVVRVQVEALGHNDIPHENAGIEIAFRFASPANKITTGPLERFIQLVRNPVYRPMLNHREAEYGAIQIEEDRAVQLVILTAQGGERAAYFFSLSKQRGGRYDACWMTDAVIRFEIEDERIESFPI